MRGLLVAGILSLMIATAEAAALTIVDVAAPDINCIYNPSCTIIVTDTTDTIVLAGTAGSGFLQSRTFKGAVGTPAQGLFGYEYRIDLRNLAGIVALPCITSFSIRFGPVAPLDYNHGDGLDAVFVVTRGGLGTVAPTSAVQVGDTITFFFDTLVCAGAFIGGGQSTFFFGLTSKTPPQVVTAQVADTLGHTTSLKARAPEVSLASRFSELREDITRLPDAVFKNNPIQRRATLLAKADEVGRMLESGHLEPAAEKLANDLDPKMVPDGRTCWACGPIPDPHLAALGLLHEIGALLGVAPNCADPVAERIEFSIISRTSQFRGRVRIVGVVKNEGAVDYVSRPDQQSLLLFQTIPGLAPVVVAEQLFQNLAAGQEVTVAFERDWDASSPAEGEFPPSYRVMLSYDPDIFLDGNPTNDDCNLNDNQLDRSGEDINALFG